ncbi:MAG: methylmalonyl-CoA mutase [Deltaproteobacteria bacterium]|nr:methylmalonyl-CoA mutase [Deltaproteobacteria bacterium]
MVEKKSKDSYEKLYSSSGIEIKPFYTPDDISNFDYNSDLSNPGCYPFTRGAYQTMYRGKVWSRRQVCGYGTAQESNKRIKYLTKQGQTALNIVFDMPTHHGLDSDDPLSEGEVGKGGVAIDTMEDMEQLFDGISLEQVSTSLITLPASIVIMAMYLAVAEKRGIPISKLAGTNQNDVFTTMAGSPIRVISARHQMKLIVDTIEFCAKHMPKWNPVSIVGYHYREAGCTAIQEIAFTLSAGIGYCQEAVNRKLKIDEFAPRLSFFYNSHNDFFEEVCKFRAARRLWARIMRERFSPNDERSCKLRFHTQTAGSTLTAQQPMNNIVRTTVQAMAAIMGGTQSLHTNSYDEALCLPTEEAVKIALRTQQILALESSLSKPIDPLAGSYFVESLTNSLEKEAAREIKHIDDMGGMLVAVEKGYIQDQIKAASYESQRKVESNEQIIVGVNDFIDKESENPITLHEVDPVLEKKQTERLNQVRAKRNELLVEKSLDELARTIDNGGNLVRPTVEAAKVYASLGEIMGVFKKKYGKYQNTQFTY